ncbi:RNAPII transcription regulator C-terminal-domain-containing protein, partial [Blyttiomyces helicus]
FSDVNDGLVTLLQVVEELGPQLTNPEPFARAKGVLLLTSLLSACTPDRIPPSSATVLIAFYLERLHDQPSVADLLGGILALLKSESLARSDVLKIPTKIFSELAIQTYPQPVRNLAFRIFEILLEKHVEEIKILGSDFVSGFVTAMDGEKDPRNLVLAFRLAKTIIVNLDFEKYAEDLFEVNFCYFPITFRSRPDDIFGITTEDLKQAMRDVISATPRFAKYAMPMLLEKMSSTSGTAKVSPSAIVFRNSLLTASLTQRDAMETLAASAPVYGAEALLPHLSDAWDFLKEEASEDENEIAALTAIRTISAVLSTAIASSKSGKSPMEMFLDLALRDTLQNLKEPELKFAKPSGKMLMAAASSSDPACHYIVNAAAPILIGQYTSEAVVTRRKAVLEVLLDFLKAGRIVYGSITIASAAEADEDFVTPLLTYKDRLFEYFTAALRNGGEYAPLRLIGVCGLHEMLMSRQLLSANEVGVAVQQYTQVILDDADEEVRAEARKLLASFSKGNPIVVLEQAFPTLFEDLPAGAWSPEVTFEHVADVLDSIRELSSDHLLPEGISRVSDRFAGVCEAPSANAADITYALSLATTLVALLEAPAGAAIEPRVVECAQQVIERLVAAVATRSSNGVLADPRAVDLIGQAIGATIRRSTAEQQSRWLVSTFAATFPTSKGADPDPTFSVLFAAVLCNCRAEVPFPEADVEGFFKKMVAFSIDWGNETFLTAISKSVAAVVNKSTDGPRLDAFLVDYVQKSLGSTILDPETIPNIRRASMLPYLWIAKALILRSHSPGYAMASDVMRLLSDADVGREAADGVGVIIGDADDGTFTKGSFAVVKILHKQRFFSHCMPLLVGGFQAASTERRHFYLIALSHLLKNIPKPILLSELPKLFPLLLSSLSFPDSELKLATLKTLQLMLKEAPAIVAEHISSVIPLLLAMATKRDEAANVMKVRIAALRTVGQLPPSIEYSVLHPHKPVVLRELSGSLDDPKRLVRKEGANARGKWFLLLGPKR